VSGCSSDIAHFFAVYRLPSLYNCGAGSLVHGDEITSIGISMRIQGGTGVFNQADCDEILLNVEKSTI
jgi:hypothetical protein